MAYTTIKKPSDYFNTVTYTGNGVDNRDITGLDFQPDMLWSKRRDSADNHSIYDIVRGDGKELRTADTGADYDRTNNIQSLNSDGFQVGDDSQVNASGGTYVSWGWSGGGTGVANTDGDIASTVSANTTSGFSIVSWTGNGTDNATVGHGLSQKPDMVIIKARENTSSWVTWHKDLTGSDYCMFLDASDAQSQYSTILKNQSASLLTLGTNSASNANTQGFISYNFHSVQGYSKFGSYTGNGSTDGTFVYTGFRPAFVMTKRTNSTNSWEIQDSTRSDFNVCNEGLYPDLSNAEGDADRYDLLSNGIKMRTSGGMNQSGGSYIYMAFAENPLVSSTGVPATAR